jgi:hypothetical protein
MILAGLEIAETYARGVGEKDCEVEMACKIDSICGRWDKRRSADGNRRHIEGASQAQTCLVWIENLRARLRRLPMDRPLDRPLLELGYATKPTERLKQHRNHTSSNYLMNLLEDIFQVMHGKKYFIDQYVILHNTHVSHAMYAEILLSRIGLVYTSQGGGFSHYIAGKSQPGVYKIPEDYWDRVQTKLCEDAAFETRFQEESRKTNALAEMYRGIIASTKDQDELLMTMEAVAAIPVMCDEYTKEQSKALNMLKQDMEPLSAIMAFLDQDVVMQE